jgi:hypothetical protein
MKLTVHVLGYANEPIEVEQTISSLDAAEKIGTQVGRMVRDFLRNVPMRKQRSTAHITIHAGWAEAAERPQLERKRKAKPKREEARAAVA